MSHKVVKVKGRSGIEIDNMALHIIRVLQPEILTRLQPFDIERFFECDMPQIFDVTTEYRELNPGIHGYTDSDLRECVISKFLVEDQTQEHFRNATIAHECGHCILHLPEVTDRKAELKFIHDADHVRLRLYRQDEIPTYQNPEWQAWRFAGALLMPTQTFSEAIRRGYSDREISRIFHVNPAFVSSRAKALKLEVNQF